MTAQAMETIYIKRRKYYFNSFPFSEYLEKLDEPPIFNSPNSDSWRGYYGRWKIKDEKLLLASLEAYIEIDGKIEEVGLNYFFPDQKEVFAKWFTGEINLTNGKDVIYPTIGYDAIFINDINIDIKEGHVISLFDNEYLNQ